MKITFIIGSLGYGGKERQLYYLIKHLPEEVEKQLIILSDIVKINDIYNHVDNVVVIHRKHKYKVRTLKKLCKEIDQFSPDIIHSWDGISPFFAKPICFAKKIKLINGSIRSARPVKRYSFRYVISKLREGISDVNISNSMKGLEVKGFNGKSNFLCIHNGFDIQYFDAKMADNQMFDKIDSADFNVCMVGRFYPLKDYKTLINVCEIINSKSTQEKIVFHAIGDGPYLPPYKNMVESRSIDNFIFHGISNNIPAILSKCDVGVLLNPEERAEGISNAIMEYMAAKLPVIATNLGGTTELVQDNVNGFLVKPYDVETVANKILLLKTNKDLIKKMGNEGRRIIVDEFSLDIMINRYMKLYKRLIF